MLSVIIQLQVWNNERQWIVKSLKITVNNNVIDDDENDISGVQSETTNYLSTCEFTPRYIVSEQKEPDKFTKRVSVAVALLYGV